MFFEIAQDDDLVLIKSTQKDTFSTGLGVTFTKHHHIREYGRLGQDSMDRWYLTHQPKNPVWKEAADSWSLSHLGYSYPGTTPVMIKLDYDRSCPWV